MNLLAITVLLSAAICEVIGNRYKRDGDAPLYKAVCYWDTNSVSRKGDGQFLVSNIDPTLCTHLVLRSAKLGQDNQLIFNSKFDPDELGDVFSLKSQNANLKILLGIEDMSESSRSYLNFPDFSSFQDQLLHSLDQVLSAHDFDGIDLDISKPDIDGKSPHIQQDIISMLKALRSYLDNHGKLLTALVAPDKENADAAYDIQQINNLVDFINLMAFDYHGGAEKYAGLNAPLYPRPGEDGDAVHLNVDWSVNYWLQNGASPSKLVMGVPSFGRTFTLKDPSQANVGAPVIGYGKAGPYLLKAGIKAYNELCYDVANNGWIVDWEPHQQTPFAYMDDQWVGYDDVGSIEIKADYVNEAQLAGAMMWNIDTDDFLPRCGKDKFPLLKQLHATLQEGNKDRPYPEPGPHPHPHPFEPVCREQGYFRNPVDCNKYYRCVAQGHDLTLIKFDCGPGTVFNEKFSVCDWPYNVDGCEQ